MYHLRLKKAKSYDGPNIRATHSAPDVFTEDEAAATAAVASGYFDLLPDETPLTNPPGAPTGTIEAIDAMNATQLRAYAKKHGLDIEEAAPKGAPIEAVREAVRDALAARDGEGDATGQFADQGGEE